MTLDALVARAARRLLEAGSPSARLDAEVLLCHVLGVERTWLYTWGDRATPVLERARFEALLAARALGHPVAYLTGEREFWGLRLATSPHTLIPRPDTERLVEAALAHGCSERGRLLDLGTGTGAIALAFASERPGWSVVGTDLRPEAVALARHNAERLAIGNVEFRSGDWFTPLDGGARFDLIVSNPPYVAADDPHLRRGDLRFEPQGALVAGEAGLADLHHLVVESRSHLVPAGWLLLEHGHGQGQAVRDALVTAGYAQVATLRDLGGQDRVSLGRHGDGRAGGEQP
ncbi:MAG: peptide chain release factor N(5)-glutamine methyltransferase [Pseudomonadota bacterium]